MKTGKQNQRTEQTHRPSVHISQVSSVYLEPFGSDFLSLHGTPGSQEAIGVQTSFAGKGIENLLGKPRWHRRLDRTKTVHQGGEPGFPASRLPNPRHSRVGHKRLLG